MPTRELLQNGGLEAGHVGALRQISGHGSVLGPGAIGSAGCTVSGRPAQARSGQFVFSSSARDGANMERRAHEVVLSQTVRLEEAGVALGSLVAASVFLAPACGADGSVYALLRVDFKSGGPDGRVLDVLTAESTGVDAGSWRQLVTPSLRIPRGTDTVEFNFRAAAAVDAPSIELWADDLSLAVCGEQGTPLAAWQPVAEAPAAAAAAPEAMPSSPVAAPPLTGAAPGVASVSSTQAAVDAQPPTEKAAQISEALRDLVALKLNADVSRLAASHAIHADRKGFVIYLRRSLRDRDWVIEMQFGSQPYVNRALQRRDRPALTTEETALLGDLPMALDNAIDLHVTLAPHVGVRIVHESHEKLIALASKIGLRDLSALVQRAYEEGQPVATGAASARAATSSSSGKPADLRLENVLSPQANTCDIRKVDWKNRAYDGEPLRNGRSVGDSTAYQKLDAVTYVDLSGDGAPEAVVEVSAADSEAPRGGVTSYYVFQVEACTLHHRPALASSRLSRYEGGHAFIGMMMGSKLRTEPGKLILTHDLFAPDDANCCPSLVQEDTWSLKDGSMQLVYSARRRHP